MTAQSAHALVVGGTGMLRDVVLHLAGKGDTVSVIARRAAPLSALVRGGADRPGRINPLSLDYADDGLLRQEILGAIAAYGPLSTVVTWIRPEARNALKTIAACAAAGAGEAAPGRCRLFRVLGSAAADPAVQRKGGGAQFRAMEGLLYREVILGFRIEAGSSRWNTSEEIGAGVIEEIERDSPDHVVGVVRPWEMNPRLRSAG